MTTREHIDGVSSHAQDRAEEYLGYNPSRETWLAVVASIVDRKAVLTHADPHGTERWIVVMDDMQVTVIWRPLRGLIVTMPPPHSVASRHFARKVPRGGIGRPPNAERNPIRLGGKLMKLKKVWR